MTITLTLNPDRTYQTIEGIGASLAWSGDPVGETWSDASKTRLADLLFCQKTGAGLSGIRFNIGAGAAWVEQNPSDPWRHPACFKRSADSPFNPDCHAGQQWFLRAAEERGAHHRTAFANSPPIWLTRNGRATQDKAHPTDTTNLKPGAEANFAAFLADVAEHFTHMGLPFTGISPVNEPQWDWEEGSQEGCRFSNDEIAAVAKALRAELDRRGLHCELDLTEAADLRFLIDDDFLEKPYIHGNEGRGLGKNREQLKDLAPLCEGKICGHGYWTYDPLAQSQRLREAVRATVDRHLPGGRFHQSEVCIMEPGRDLGIDTALRIARMMHQDFVHANASGWFWWLALSPYDYKDGLIYLEANEGILPAKNLWAVGNYARFLRPGWQRIEVTPSEPVEGLYISAWRNPETSHYALVVVNTTTEEHTLHLPELDSLTAYTTDADRDLEQSETLLIEAPLIAAPRSVTTWVPTIC